MTPDYMTFFPFMLSIFPQLVKSTVFFYKLTILHKCYVQIKTNVLSYAISDVLNQLISRINLDKVFTKTHLG